MKKHLSDLEANKHPNDVLQRNFNLTGRFDSDILWLGSTWFRARMARVEQYYINRYSNCNEIRAKANRDSTLIRISQYLIDNILIQGGM